MLFNCAENTGLALSDFDSEKSWQTVESDCLRLANWLLTENALQPGDHIALLAGNRVEYVETVLAAIIAGLWITPINTHLLADEIAYIVNDCDAKLVLYDTAHEQLLSPNISAPRATIESAFSQIQDTDKFDKPISLEGPAGGTMIYTSGTTGRPKGVKRFKPATLGEALERMKSGARLFGLTGNGPHLITGPMYHAAPMLLALYDMLNGAPLFIMKKWDTEAFIEIVANSRITTTHLVPTMFVRLLNYYRDMIVPTCPDLAAWNGRFSSLQLVLHGAAPIARVTKEDMINWWGAILVEYWGATEGGITTMANSKEWLEHPGTVGKSLPNFEVYVGDEQGDPVTDQEGLLYCRHKQLSQVFEYHKDADKTAKSHPQPHVFCTGDIGHVDQDGFVYLSDRKSNMIISGGVNIYPAEIEQALMAHPAIEDIAVFGIPNPEWGEEVKAVVQLKAGFEKNDQVALDILDFARASVAKYKVPRTLDFQDELPRTPAGKLLIRKLKEVYL